MSPLFSVCTMSPCGQFRLFLAIETDYCRHDVLFLSTVRSRPRESKVKVITAYDLPHSGAGEHYCPRLSVCISRQCSPIVGPFYVFELIRCSPPLIPPQSGSPGLL